MLSTCLIDQIDQELDKFFNCDGSRYNSYEIGTFANFCSNDDHYIDDDFLNDELSDMNSSTLLLFNPFPNTRNKLNKNEIFNIIKKCYNKITNGMYNLSRCLNIVII